MYRLYCCAPVDGSNDDIDNLSSGNRDSSTRHRCSGLPEVVQRGYLDVNVGGNPGESGLVRASSTCGESNRPRDCESLRRPCNHLVLFPQHHLLQENQVSKSGNVLESLTFELSQARRATP